MTMKTTKAECQLRRFLMTGKTAVVTGGHRGIGQAISMGIALAGGNVIVIDRSGPKGTSVPEEIRLAGQKHGAVQANLNDKEEVVRAANEAKQIAAQWGTRIDVLVNNAAVARLSPIESVVVDEWDDTMNVNVRAPMLLARELVNGPDGMLANGGGVIVNVSSVAGQAALPRHSAYSASKAALEMLTKTMTSEWASRGIRANTVSPTVVLTAMGRAVWQDTQEGEDMVKRLPVGRFAESNEISDVILFLCSDASAMIHGAIIPIDGGYAVL